MAGARVSFRARIAEADSAVRISRKVKKPSIMADWNPEGRGGKRDVNMACVVVNWNGSQPDGSDGAGGDVDHQGEKRGVEDEGYDAVRCRGAPDQAVGDPDIGDLRGHADHE